MTGLQEREPELAAIGEAVSRALAGEGAVVVVEGAAGIGKTRLLGELRSGAGDALVLTARGADHEQDFAFGVVRQLLERPLLSRADGERAALLGGAAALAGPALGLPGAVEGAPSLDVPDPAFGAFHGLYWLAVNLSAERPLVLVVDDAHWADLPSLRWCTYLARRLEGLPVLLAVAARETDGPEHELVRGLAAEPGAVVVRPSELSRVAVAAMAVEVFGCEVEDAFAAACHQTTGGVPFFVDELLRALEADGVGPVAAESDRVLRIGPPAVARSVLLRVGSLPEAARSLVPAIAVLGTEASLSRAAALAGVDESSAAEALDALAAAHLIASDGPLAFAHPIIGATVDGEMRPGERARLHAAGARLLHETGADPGRVAQLLVAAPAVGEPWAAAALRTAASDAVARGAPQSAVRLLGRALAEPEAAPPGPATAATPRYAAPPRAIPGTPPVAGGTILKLSAVGASGDPAHVPARAGLLAELGAAELRAGDPAAIEHLRAAVDAAPGEIAHARLLGRALTAAGRHAEAVTALARLADQAGPEGAMLLDGDLASFAAMDRALAPEAAVRLERHRGAAGATRGERLVLVGLAHRAWVEGRSLAETAELAERALGGGALLADETADSVAYHQAVYALIVADGLDAAQPHLAAARDEARARGSFYGYAATSTNAALAHLRAGRVADAEAEARAALEGGEHALLTPMVRGFLALALVERDEVDAAAATLDEVGELQESMPSIHVSLARGRVALQRGDWAAAQAGAEDAGRREQAFGVANPILGWRLLLAAAVGRQGDIARASELITEQAAMCERWGSPALLSPVRRAQALFTPAEAVERLTDALALAREGVDRLDEARALIDLGAALRRAGERVAAREPLTEALTLSQRLGAVLVATRAHKELQVAGARPRRLQFSGVDSLTAAERRVVDLAARGLTNRDIAQSLFVTPKTVENHLGRAFRKLDVSAREDLATALAG